MSPCTYFSGLMEVPTSDTGVGLPQQRPKPVGVDCDGNSLFKAGRKVKSAENYFSTYLLNLYYMYNVFKYMHKE